MEGVGVGVAVRGCVETNALCEMDWSDLSDGEDDNEKEGRHRRLVYNHVTHKRATIIYHDLSRANLLRVMATSPLLRLPIPNSRQ